VSYYPVCIDGIYDIIHEDSNGEKFSMNESGEPCYNPQELIEFIGQLYLQRCFSTEGIAIDLIQSVLDKYGWLNELCDYNTGCNLGTATADEIFASQTSGDITGAFKHWDRHITCYTI